jgi:hypothetical protein
MRTDAHPTSQPRPKLGCHFRLGPLRLRPGGDDSLACGAVRQANLNELAAVLILTRLNVSS